MKLAERKGQYSMVIPYYEEVEDDLLEFRPGIRVLPAPYFNEPNLLFEFRKRHEPGEPGWRDGGYELRGPDGESRAFDLDQLIVHPSLVKRKISLNVETGEVEQKAIKVKSDRGKGRPALDPEERQRRIDARLKPRNPNSTGKRGRPAMDPELKAIQEKLKAEKPKSTGEAKRGRKPLDPAVKALRELENRIKLEKHGKRGRGRPPKGENKS
jgi:hypothetical protein